MPRPRTKERLSALSRLALVRAKVERSKQNLFDMERRLAEFHGDVSGAKREVPSKRREAGQIHTYHIPFDTLAAAGDVLNNLRGALDHLICQLALARNPRRTRKQLKSGSFPIYETEAAYIKFGSANTKFIHPGAKKLIDSLKPYKSGNYPLWLLNELNNTSKHRILLKIAPTIMCHADWIGEMSVSTMFMYTKLGRPQFSGIWGKPKQHGYILATGKEALVKLRPGQREALVPVLYYLIGVVDALIKEFLPYLG